MPEYMSPGVYVEEVPSAVKPIAGVSTSTAAFVGVIPDQIEIPEENPAYDPTHPEAAKPYRTWTFPVTDDAVAAAKSAADDAKKNVDPKDPKKVKAMRDAQRDYSLAQARQNLGDMAGSQEPVLCTNFSDFTRNFGGFPSLLGNSEKPLDPKKADDAKGIALYQGAQWLAQGVYGFFHNGGTRCYVMRFADFTQLSMDDAFTPLEAIDEISLVVAPGITDPTIQSNILDHCENLASRFAILDGPTPDALKGANPDEQTIRTQNGKTQPLRNSAYGAVYIPWINVFDAGTKLADPDGDGEIAMGPSGHIAGIYSRVDHERGVHKAPANELVRGALGVTMQISKGVQDGINPPGINCIRIINDGITVWGARTIGGDANQDLKYINVRRTLIFLRESIDRGTQWVVFEPNDRALWAKIVRNVGAFLTNVWRDGALFGATPQEAFYVKCDDELNPPEERDLGKVTTEIGVSIVRPAEFVIFRISQWAGPKGQ